MSDYSMRHKTLHKPYVVCKRLIHMFKRTLAHAVAPIRSSPEEWDDWLLAEGAVPDEAGKPGLLTAGIFPVPYIRII